jgi:hypothetical protein
MPMKLDDVQDQAGATGSGPRAEVAQSGWCDCVGDVGVWLDAHNRWIRGGTGDGGRRGLRIQCQGLEMRATPQVADWCSSAHPCQSPTLAAGLTATGRCLPHGSGPRGTATGALSAGPLDTGGAAPRCTAAPTQVCRC